jgi:hypothetical protein
MNQLESEFDDIENLEQYFCEGCGFSLDECVCDIMKEEEDADD